MGEKIRVAVYTRVSTDREEQKTSLQFQQEKYQKYCEEKGYQLIHIYADEGLTGTNNKRKAFLEMMNDGGLSYTLKQGKGIEFDSTDKKPLFDLIIVKDVSRFARNINAAKVVDLLHEKDVFVLFENNNLSTKDTTKSEWKMRLNLDLTFAEKESLDKSEKIKWTRDHKAKQGKYHFSRIPFGYYYNEDTNLYEVKEDEAKVIKHMFHMYVNEDKGCRLIREWLQKKGIVNRTAKNNNPLWNEATINRMLKNEVYTGTVILGKYENNISGTGRRKKRKETEWIRLENAIPAIIDKELFDAATATRKKRITKLSDNTLKGMRLSADIFARKIKCSKCGSLFTRVSGVKKDKEGNKRLEATYYCYNRRKYKKCDMRGISFNVLERELMKATSNLKDHYKHQSNEQEMEWKNELLDLLDEKETRAKEEMDKIENKIAVIDEKLSLITEKFIYAKGNMIESLNQKHDELQTEKDKLLLWYTSFGLIEINKERDKINQRYRRILEIGEREYNSLEEVVDVLDHIAIEEGKNIKFHFKMETFFDALLWLTNSDDPVDKFQTIDREKNVKTLFHTEVKY